MIILLDDLCHMTSILHTTTFNTCLRVTELADIAS